jgi:hypothetical protein
VQFSNMTCSKKTTLGPCVIVWHFEGSNVINKILEFDEFLIDYEILEHTRKHFFVCSVKGIKGT